MTTPSSASAALIAVDWGTTNRRGFLLSGNGDILDTREDALGLVNIRDDRFQDALENLTGTWTAQYGVLPTLLSGMVGASTGWREAPYCPLPAGLDDLAAGLVRAPCDDPVWIVPGACTRDDGNLPDVIRGEEIQALAAHHSAGSGLLVAPGTHSKWIETEAGRIIRFTTYMTGDLHAAILNHTVVSALREGSGMTRLDAFDGGVETGFRHPGDLPHTLFGARTLVLFGEMTPDGVADYLSGLLIGAELASALDRYDPAEVTLIGKPALCQLYGRALETRGIAIREVAADECGTVYAALAARAGLLKE